MAGNPYLWSTTSATNTNSDGDINWVEGQLPSTVNDSARGMMAGVAGWLKDTNSTLTTGGSANAQTVTSNIAYAALATGIRLHVKAGFTNTTACTLNLTPAGGGAFGAKAIKIIIDSGEIDPVASNIRVDGHYVLEYDAAANAAAGAWILLNPSLLTTPVVQVVAVQTFTASGTYTPHTGMLYCIIELVGGGGGGGSARNGGSNTCFGGGGGGSGGYSRKIATAADIGASKAVTVGAAGTAGSTGGTGGNGGITSVGSLCVANGGFGGAGTTAGSAFPTAGSGASVSAAVGDVLAAGSPGVAGAYTTAGDFVGPGGNGGTSVLGGGGLGLAASSGSVATGGTGFLGGGGAGGAVRDVSSGSGSGGAGGSGIAIIMEFCA